MEPSNDLVTLIITQLPNFAGFGIALLVLAWLLRGTVAQLCETNAKLLDRLEDINRNCFDVITAIRSLESSERRGEAYPTPSAIKDPDDPEP